MKNIKKFYPILTGINNPVLRKISLPVEKIDEEIQVFAEELMQLMWENDGAWLAAPQIGKNIRMIATTQRRETKKDLKLLWKTLMINPEIVEQSKEMVVSLEACLSIPNFSGKVKRHKSITVQYLDIQGRKHIRKFKDLDAFIIQHEYDHLDGILFVDKVISSKAKK
jgi:peptide deformylase